MGYSNPAHFFKLKTTRNCIKYCSHIERMSYTEYKEMRTLYDFSKTDMVKYNAIITRIYSELSDIDFEKVNAVFLTNGLLDFVKNDEKYVERLIHEIEGNLQENAVVLIKRHPRDDTHYQFDSKIKAIELNQQIPGEVILPYIDGKKIIMMLTTSMLLYFDGKKCEKELLYFQDVYDENRKNVTYLKYPSKEEIEEILKKNGWLDVVIKKI